MRATHSLSMEPKTKKVKFNLITETMIISSDDGEVDSDGQEQSDTGNGISAKPAQTATSKKIIGRRNSVDFEDEIPSAGGTLASENIVEMIEEDEEIICITDSDKGDAQLNCDKANLSKLMADENEWIEKYKKSCQQYSFINPLPHGKREETFPCQFRREGCSYASDNIRTAVHIHSCNYRPVICTASEECGQIPFTMYLEHIRDIHEATGMVSNRRWWYHEQSILGDTPAGNVRLPIYIRKYDGQTFLLNTQIFQSKAHWWMTMHGELEKIGNYCISVRVVPRLDRKSTDDFLRSADLDVYLSRQVIVNGVPGSNFGVSWDELFDYCYEKPKDEKKATYWRIKVTIKRKKQKSNLALLAMGKEMKAGSKLRC